MSLTSCLSEEDGEPFINVLAERLLLDLFGVCGIHRAFPAKVENPDSWLTSPSSLGGIIVCDELARCVNGAPVFPARFSDWFTSANGRSSEGLGDGKEKPGENDFIQAWWDDAASASSIILVRFCELEKLDSITIGSCAFKATSIILVRFCDGDKDSVSSSTSWSIEGSILFTVVDVKAGSSWGSDSCRSVVDCPDKWGTDACRLASWATFGSIRVNSHWWPDAARRGQPKYFLLDKYDYESRSSEIWILNSPATTGDFQGCIKTASTFNFLAFAHCRDSL